MAKFMESTSSIKNSVKKKKEDESAKKKTTKAASSKPKTQSSVSSKKAQTTVNRLSNKYAGGSTRNTSKPKATTTKPKATTTAPKKTATTTSRNPRMQDAVVQSKPVKTTKRDTTPVSSQKSKQVQQNLQQKYGENKVNNTVNRRDTTPVKPNRAEKARDNVSTSRNPRMLDTARNTSRDTGRNTAPVNSKPSKQSVEVQNRLTAKYGTNKVEGGKHSRMDDVADFSKTLVKGAGQGAKLAITEDRKILNRFSNRSTGNKFYNRELNAEDRAKNQRKVDLRDEGLRIKILKQQEEMERTANEPRSYIGKMAVQGAQSLGGMLVDRATGPMSLVHMGLRVTEGSYVSEDNKVRQLKNRVKQSGNYTDDEINEMFKGMDRRVWASAISEGGIEAASELMFGGLGLAKGYVRGAGFLDNATSKLLGKASGRLNANLFGKVALGTAEEIAEEEIGNPLQALSSNFLLNDRLQSINEDNTRRSVEAQSQALINRIHSDEESRAVAANLNSASFLEETAKGYMETGASKKEANELAKLTRDYLYASVTGNTERANSLRDQMVTRLAGGENSYKEKWTFKDAIDAAVSTGIMTAATGAPVAMTSAAIGNAYKAERGNENVRKLAEITKSLDPEKSARAQAMIERIDSGRDLTGTQVHDLIQWSNNAAVEGTKREQSKMDLSRKKMRQEDLRVEPMTRLMDGTYILSEKTEERFEQIADETAERAEMLNKAARKAQKRIKKGKTVSEDIADFNISEEDAYVIGDVTAAYETGTITAEQINELNIDRPENRAVFKSMTGIDLDQYNVRTRGGNIDEAASNVRMQNALMARAAENYVQSARAEQENWNDKARGQVQKAMSERGQRTMSSAEKVDGYGDRAMTKALESVDPRDRGKFTLMASAAANVYNDARYRSFSWDEAKHAYSESYKGLDQNALRDVFEAAKKDKVIAENKNYGKRVDAGGTIEKNSLQNSTPIIMPGKVIDNRSDQSVKLSEKSFFYTAATTFGSNVTLVDDLPMRDAQGKIVYRNKQTGERIDEDSFTGLPEEEQMYYSPVQLEGSQSSTAGIVLNTNAGIKRNIEDVVKHETIHQIRTNAPEQFKELARFLQDQMYRADPEGFMDTIKAKQEQYKAAGQDLTVEGAMEELIAEGGVSLDWEQLIQDIQTDPNVKSKRTLLETIRDAFAAIIRKLRSILSSGDVITEDARNATLDELMRMDEAYQLLVKAAYEAKAEEAAQAVDELQNQIYEEGRLSISTTNDVLANRDDTAVFIKNTKNANYIDMILNGEKTEETRATRTLDKFIGKEVMLTDGKKVYGTVVFGEPHQYTAEEFHSEEAQARHRVPVGDAYDIQEGKTKWAYPIESYTKYDEPRKLSNDRDYLGTRQAREVRYSISDSNISSYSTDAYSGQVNMRTEYKDDSGNVLGYVEWNDYEGTPNISYISVDEGSRRQGIATRLLQYIQKQYPDTEINFGMTTEDGTALLDAITHDVVDADLQSRQDELAQKSQELEDIGNRLNELYEIEDWTEEQDAEASELGPRWDALNREVHDLEEEIDGRSATRRMVNMPKTRFSISDPTNANDYVEEQLLEDSENTVQDLAESDLSIRYSFGEGGTFYDKGFHASSGTNVTGSDVKKRKGNPLLQSGKEILAKKMTKNIKAELKKQGISTRSKEAKDIINARIESVMNFMDAMNNFMEDTGLQYTFIGMQDVHNAKISVRKTSDGVQSITMSAMVKNGEYPINFDFTTICKKRQAFNAIIEKLTDETAEGADISLSPKELGEINNALRKEGLETACLGCFVEARRYNMQNYTNKVCDLWNKCVDDYAASIGIDPKSIEDFNFANGEETTEEKFQDAADTFFAYENTAASKKNPEDRFRHIIRSSQKTYMKHLHPADLITSNGIQHIKDMSTKSKDFFGMLKSAYGVAAPKETIKYVPYNSEVALLPENRGKNKDGSTQTMLDYLKSIGGIRMQSFSDYLVANTFDYMQMVADMAARGFPAHAYTKEIAFARVFGMTGIKINLSIMYDVQNLKYWKGIFKDASDERLREIAAKYAGLQYFENVDDIPEEFKDYDKDGNLILDHGSIMEIDEDGVKGYLTYLVGDENRSQRFWEETYRQVLEETGDEAQAEEQANEYRKWIQSINFKDAKELQRKKGYGRNCGMIGVGLSNANILLMLNDDNMPYIIPYHASGLPDVIKQHTGLNFATNYEDTQNTRIFVNFVNKDGKELGYEYVKDLKNELGSWQKAWEKVSEEIRNGEIVANGRTPRAATDKAPAEVNKDGDPYVLHGTADFDFYGKLDNGATPQEAAEMYLEYCDEYGLLPVFPQFAGHPNYYKLLVDYSVTDLSDNKATSPQGTVHNIYPGSNGTIANIDEGSTDYEGIKGILEDEFEKLNKKNKHRDETVEKIVEEWKKYSITPDMDDAYMFAVNSGNMEEAQRLVNEAAERAGYTTEAWHQTGGIFTVFNNDNPQAAINDSETPNGLFFKTNDHDIGLEGKRQMHVFLNTGRLLQFKNREEANQWYRQHVANYEALDEAKNADVGVIDDRMEALENLMFGEDVTDEQYNALSSEWDEMLEELRTVENGYRGRLRELLNDYFLSDSRQFDGIYIGYDGHRYVNGKREDVETYIVFDSNQVKSADPVTYAEDGSVIPLSERFDPDNNDIRYSLPTQDSDGNILSDGQMEYFKNSQARDEQGRLVPMYHVTPVGGFTVFDPAYSSDQRSISFTNDMDFALNYSSEDEDIDAYRTAYETRLGDGETEGLGHYKVYLNMQNPYIVDGSDIVFNDEVAELTAYAQSEGYDGLIMRNFQDLDADIYQVFSSNQIKDTRNTDPTENPDIRWSVPEDEVKDRVAYTDAMENSFEELEAYEAYISEHPDDVESYVAKNFDEETVSAFNSALVDYSGKMFDDRVLEDGRVRIAKSREDFFRSVNAKWRESWPTEGEVLNIDSVKGNIRKLVRGVMANADANHQYKTDVANMTLADARTAFQLMKQGRQEYAMNLLYHSAQRMVEGIQFVQDDTEFQTYKEIRAFMRNSKVSIDEEYWNDVDYQKFRRENMSRMKLIRGKQNVEDVYSDLQDNWPWIFNEEEREKIGLGNDVPALLLHIGHVLDQNLTPFMAAYSSEDATALCFDIADQLYDIIEAGRPIKSLADSMNKRDAKKLDKLYDQMEENAANAEREYAKSIEDLKEQFDQQTKALKVRHDEAVRKVKANMAEMEEAKNAEIDKLRKEANDTFLLNKAAIARERAAKWQAIEEEKAKRAKETERANMWRGRYKERVQKDVQDRKDKAERKSHKKQFTKVQNNYDWLVKRLLSPTKDKNIPEQLRVPLAKLLMQFDLQTENSKKLEEKYGPAKKTLQMRELKDKIAAVSKEDESGELPYSTWLVGSMEQLSESLDDKPIDSLSTGDIALINEVLSTIIHGINNHQKIRINGKKVEIASYGDKTISNLHERIGKFGQRKDFIGTIGLFDRLVNEGEETPIYFFSRLDPASDGIGAMYRELRKGEDKHIRNMNYLRNRFRDITGEFFNEKGPGSKLEEWRSIRNAQTFDLSGGPITLTPAQMMSLVCLADRKDALDHLLVGGIVATPVSFGAKMTDKLKPVSVKTSSTHITKDEIEMIRSKLTPDQAKVAKKLQQLMAKEMADWGNETSMDMYGIKMFKDPDYFPMRSSQMELPTDPNNAANDKTEKIRNFGFTKPITPNANNAIYIDDIFSVVADHCNKMSLYNSMAIPIMDFMKVYNYKQRNDDGSTVTVKETIGDAFTKKANAYIEKFLADVNGNTQTKSDAVDALFNKSLANYKKASIGANMRVALQQPTAIVRALQVLDPKWFVGIRPSAKATREMFEHCPIALWKSWGHYDMDMGRDMEDIMMNNDWSKWDTATMGVYGRLDDMTWGMIWQAVKKEVKAKNPKVDVNSEEFYELCNERASEVFDKTQVVDSIFHRSDTMRAKNTLTKMATSFMAEPTLTYNVFRNALVTGNEMWKTGDRKGAVKTWNRMAIVLMMNAAAVSAAAAIWDAVRGKGGDDDDDKGKVDLWWENFMANFMDNAPWAQWNNIYFVKDVISLKDGWGTSNMALEGFATFFKGVGQLKKKVTEGSDKSWYEVAMNTAGGLGYIFGVPAKTILRDTKAIFDFFGIEVSAMDSLSDTSKNEPVIKIGGLTDKISKMLPFGKDSESDSKKSDSSSSDAEGSWDDVYKELEAEEQQLAKLEEKAAKNAASAPAGQRDEVLWDTLTKGYTTKLKEGHMDYIDSLRDIYVRNGGREEVFDSKLLEGIKHNYKSTINAENTADQMEGQYDMQQYMLNHGVTAEEISDMCYHSYTAKDLKAAMRLGNEEYMIDELVPLIQAGFSEEDFNKCWKQRYNYRNYTGKYTDPKYRISTGTYAWPITGTITSRFGRRSSPGGVGSTNHMGLDIAGSMGDPVHAADGGEVIYADWWYGGGNVVRIRHENGEVTEYMHLSGYNCKVGDHVGKGDQIGQVGSTGNSTGPHLHFGVMDKDGNHLDPEVILAQSNKG